MILIAVPLLMGCKKTVAVDPSDSFPACRGEYSKKGDSEAAEKLLNEFQDMVTLVSKKDDVFLISEIKTTRGSLIKREEWVCKVQKKYGKPEDNFNPKDAVAYVNQGRDRGRF